MIKNISIVFIVFSLTACAQFDGNFLNSSDPVVEQSNDDISKIKIRSPGMGGDLLKTMGATPVNIPGGEILQALSSGAIDAADWSNPVMDLAFGFYKVAKYCYYPDFKKPTVSISLGMNLDKWKSFDDGTKSIIE